MIDKNTHPPGTAIDEALWTAYRRADKAAVTAYLFGRSMAGIGCSRPLPQLVIKESWKNDRTAKPAHSERMPINGGGRRISLRFPRN